MYIFQIRSCGCIETCHHNQYLAYLHWNFRNQTHVTTTSCTNSAKNNEFLILLGTSTVAFRISRYMVQYFTQVMFMCYICQKKSCVLKHFLSDKSITVEGASGIISIAANLPNVHLAGLVVVFVSV